jgi:5-methylcytosine-specific restriction endonuclease McrBC regulatory subunit McrC
MRTTDNNGGKPLAAIEDEGEGGDDSQTTIENLSAIANKKLSDLQKENPDLLVFPKGFDVYHDDIGKLHICSLYDDKLTTYNLMGFVGRNDTQLTISSRFTRSNDRTRGNNCDYFLHYMLGKVLSLNVVNLDTTKNNEGIEDFLPYLFPAYLKKALSQGIYKEYRRNEYNDANVRGVIDVSRNIRLNIPFTGKIAYNKREYCYDNTMTELVRHTIEHLRTLPMATAILTAATDDIRSNVQIIKDCTLSYNKNDRRRIINANLKPARHPYYTDYLPLQRLCLQILKHEKVSFGTDKDKIHGLLFDGAWLWEEYLNSILKNDFSHPRNKTKEGKEYLFTFNGKNKQEIYPDFINKNKKIIADAKYKHLEYKNEEYGREDYFQIITYMYRFQAKYGFLLFPHPEKIFCDTYSIIETEGHVTKLGLAIPRQSEKYETFCHNISENEKEFLTKVLC